MTPETKEKAISLVKNRLTLDSINELVTILMLEKTTLLNEQMVFDDWERGEIANDPARNILSK